MPSVIIDLEEESNDEDEDDGYGGCNPHSYSPLVTNHVYCGIGWILGLRVLDFCSD